MGVGSTGMTNDDISYAQIVGNVIITEDAAFAYYMVPREKVMNSKKLHNIGIVRYILAHTLRCKPL